MSAQATPATGPDDLAQTAPVIELDRLSVRFGSRDILKQLEGSLRGRSIGLLGPNGAGKTTLVHTLLGFHPASAGTARVLGHDISEKKWIRRHVGYMPENDAFIAGMTAVSFVRMMAELSGVPSRLALERAHEALFYVGLGEARYRPLESFSLGMKQQAKLAQAIVHGPKVLFLDEPTNGLDPPHRRRMLELIQDMRESGEVSLILSSHLLRDVEESCERVLVLKDGEVAKYCDLEEERRANRKFVELEAQGDRNRFAEAVAQLGCEAALSPNNHIKLVLPQTIGIRDLYRVASANQVEIRQLSFKRNSLEEIFLRAMGHADGGL